VVDDLLLADAHLLKMMRIALKRGDATRAWDYATLLYFPKYRSSFSVSRAVSSDAVSHFCNVPTSCACRSLHIAVKMAEMQRSLKLVDKLLDLLDERKESFEEERKQLAAREQHDEAQQQHEDEAAPAFVLNWRSNQPELSGHAMDEEGEADDEEAYALKPTKKRARKSIEATVKPAGVKKSVAGGAPLSRREGGDHGAAAAAAASASSFSFTSVRSESGAVSVRLAGRASRVAPVAVDQPPLRGKENVASPTATSKTVASKKTTAPAVSKKDSAKTKTKKPATKTDSEDGAPAGKRKRELTQPRLNFAKQQP
jgi:hypothetical protein